jgi:hypothetical protein
MMGKNANPPRFFKCAEGVFITYLRRVSGGRAQNVAIKDSAFSISATGIGEQLDGNHQYGQN